MFEIFGIPLTALFGQLLIGLINGSFYALLSLGLAVIFGMLNIINFAHGAQYMMGAFCAYLLLNGIDIPLPDGIGRWPPTFTVRHVETGLDYWWSLALAPIIVGAIGVAIERLFLRWLYRLDHLYGLLLTFGLALIIEGCSVRISARRGCPIGCPMPSKAPRTLASCSCPITAPG